PTVPIFQQMGTAGLAGTALRDSKGRRIGSLFVFSRRPLGAVTHVASMLRLFAVRTAAEIERQLEEHRFHDLFEFSPDAILMINEAGIIVRANRRAETLLGYSRAELHGLQVEVLIPEAERPGHANLRQAFFATATPRLMGTGGDPLHVRRKDGSVFPADIGLSPLRSEGGLLMAVDVRDVSERVRSEAQRASLEAQLRHAQKMEAIGTLAGGIAHDFNNLLAAMVANLELARGDVAADHPAVESLDAIGVAADRARQLVRQILAFSRRNPPQRVVVSPGTMVEEVLHLLRATVPKGINITTAVDETAPDVFVDPTQIHQVLMNLATNAWHAIERGVGDIALSVTPATIRSKGTAPGALAPGEYARFVVADTGRGMTPETLDRIFEPFFTTKQVGRGSGLGLSVVHGIVTDHGGAVTVDSRPNEGTRVSVYLPASTVRVEATSRGAEPLRTGAGRVAFVDDEPAMVITARRLLRRLGYAAMVFDRPADVIDAVRHNPACFDIVITDCNMPGMSGLDVARELAGIRRDLPVVLMSGFADRTEEELAAAGIRFRLDKPFTMQELNAVVQRALAG
ncbi:MAG: ATP-binding protein, partial [Vicinamibacterales bacterium]